MPQQQQNFYLGLRQEPVCTCKIYGEKGTGKELKDSLSTCVNFISKDPSCVK